MSLPNKSAVVSHLAGREILTATENWVNFLILQAGTSRLRLSTEHGQNLDPRKTRMKNRV
jgi:hypothetical protein